MHGLYDEALRFNLRRLLTHQKFFNISTFQLVINNLLVSELKVLSNLQKSVSVYRLTHERYFFKDYTV